MARGEGTAGYENVLERNADDGTRGGGINPPLPLPRPGPYRRSSAGDEGGGDIAGGDVAPPGLLNSAHRGHLRFVSVQVMINFVHLNMNRSCDSLICPI